MVLSVKQLALQVAKNYSDIKKTAGYIVSLLDHTNKVAVVQYPNHTCYNISNGQSLLDDNPKKIFGYNKWFMKSEDGLGLTTWIYQGDDGKVYDVDDGIPKGVKLTVVETDNKKYSWEDLYNGNFDPHEVQEVE